jgi:hypothetical protein
MLIGLAAFCRRLIPITAMTAAIGMHRKNYAADLAAASEFVLRGSQTSAHAAGAASIDTVARRIWPRPASLLCARF